MWKLYDALIDSAAPGARLKDLAVGAEWTAVLTEDGSLGLAPTIMERVRRFDIQIKPVPGTDLTEIVPGIKSWNYFEAAMGLAALNAIHNRMDAVPDNAFHRPKGRRNIGAFIKFCQENFGGRHTLLVEPMYYREDMHSVPGIFDIMRQDTSYRDYHSHAYRELVPACEQLIMSGTPLVNKRSAPILDLAAHCHTHLWGIDIPLANTFADFNVNELTGFIVDDPEKCMWTVKTGGTRDQIIKLGHFVTFEIGKE